jgi:glutamate-5-semialdehyde dehydrogenase
MNTGKYVLDVVQAAKEASVSISNLPTADKDIALTFMADELLRSASKILQANRKDIDTSTRLKKTPAFIDRLRLNENTITLMASALIDITKLPDPIGCVERMSKRPNGLLIGRMRVPIGVIFIVYESRPNVTSDAAGLCLKSGNCCILRGGKESICTNIAIADALKKGLGRAGIDRSAIQIITTPEKEVIDLLLKQNRYIDLVIPRGGEELIKKVTENSSIPVIKHYKGVCHIFVDSSADIKMCCKIIYNAKVQRPGVCNAVECILVHRDIAKRLLLDLSTMLFSAGVEIRGCDRTCSIVPKAKKATTTDWGKEFLDLILAVRIVDSIDEAIKHIRTYGSLHSDAILTQNHTSAMRFLREVDSACVYVNASTRFTDGGQFGMGAEIGISTDKIHARGPMGLEELTSYKYIVFGCGQIRE